LAFADIHGAILDYLITKALIKFSLRQGHAEHDLTDPFCRRFLLEGLHKRSTVPFKLKPGLNEDTEDVVVDNGSGSDYLPIIFSHKNCALLMPLDDFRFRMEVFEIPNGPGRVKRGYETSIVQWISS
jgi:hypothetical protein